MVYSLNGVVNLLVFVCISTFVTTGRSTAPQRKVHKHDLTIPAKHVTIVQMRRHEVLYIIVCYGMVCVCVKAVGWVRSCLKAHHAICAIVFVSGAYFSIRRYGQLNCQPSIGR